MEGVKHLGHDHPLMLIKKEEIDDSWDLTCYGCQRPISDSHSSDYYGCKRCGFFLDKTCGELPLEMIHPFHPHHPLTFLPNPPGSRFCDVCTEDCNRFIYSCSDCDFDIDMGCASAVLTIQQSIKHRSHPHPLIPLQKESMFFCDACGEEHKGSSFLCTTCGFWINQKCASLPLTVKLNNHHHTLFLIYVNLEKEHSGYFCSCRICFKKLYKRSWVYRCIQCNYFVHIRCAASRKEVYETETENPDLLVTKTSNTKLSKNPDLINLPVPDDSIDIITQFIKNIGMQEKYKEAEEIEHFSHEHPLTFFEKPIDQASCSKGNYLPLLNGAKNDKKCSGCAKSISAPFYHCVQCNFFLHVWCVELPKELRFPCDPEHTLFLSTTGDIQRCSCCKLAGNVFRYKCKICSFTVDCKCASLPRVIKHESHKHALRLWPTLSSICVSCRGRFGYSFECGGCKFNLCVNCVLLPGTVRHRYDEHPFNLTYSPLPYETEDDFCEICEEGIDSKCWFYHCGKCDQSLHTRCILPVYIDSNVVHGSVFESERHPHPLTCVEVHLDKGFSCSLCKGKRKYRRAYQTAYVCSQCKFGICILCILYRHWKI